MFCGLCALLLLAAAPHLADASVGDSNKTARVNATDDGENFSLDGPFGQGMVVQNFSLVSCD